MLFPNPQLDARDTITHERPSDGWAAFLACRPFSVPGSLDRERPDAPMIVSKTKPYTPQAKKRDHAPTPHFQDHHLLPAPRYVRGGATGEGGRGPRHERTGARSPPIVHGREGACAARKGWNACGPGGRDRLRHKEEIKMSNKHDATPAALYARVSSDRQDVDLSVAAQLRALRDYAAKNGYTVVREFVDEAESGRIADRPQFRKMIDEAARTQAPFPGDFGLEVQPVHPQEGARRRLQVHAPAQGCPRGLHHRARRRHPHRQADGGHHRERGRVL